MAEMNFGGVTETVVTSKEFSLEKAREVLKNETIAVIGYGIQGPGQACNLRDNGFNVIVGQRQGKTFEKAKDAKGQTFPGQLTVVQLKDGETVTREQLWYTRNLGFTITLR